MLLRQGIGRQHTQEALSDTVIGPVLPAYAAKAHLLCRLRSRPDAAWFVNQDLFAAVSHCLEVVYQQGKAPGDMAIGLTLPAYDAKAHLLCRLRFRRDAALLCELEIYELAVSRCLEEARQQSKAPVGMAIGPALPAYAVKPACFVACAPALMWLGFVNRKFLRWPFLIALRRLANRVKRQAVWLSTRRCG